MNPDDYKIKSNVRVEGPDFSATAASIAEAESFLRLIQHLLRKAQQTKLNYDTAVAHQRGQIRTTRRERDEALDEVKALQDEVNRLEAELQAARKNPDETDVLRAEVEALKEQVNTHEMRNSFERQRSGRLEAELQAERSCTCSEPAYMADGQDVFWTEEGRASGGLPGMHHIIFENEGEAKDGLAILNELVKQRDQARARVAELEEAAPAAPEDDTEDGGPYSVICDRIVGNQIRSDEGVLTRNPASFSAVGFAPNEAEAFCDRLNRERDRRIEAERERDALRDAAEPTRHEEGPGYIAMNEHVLWSSQNHSSQPVVPDSAGLLFQTQAEAKEGLQILNGLVKQRDKARARSVVFETSLAAEKRAHRACFDKVKGLEEQARKAQAHVADLRGEKRDATYFQQCLKAEETAHRVCFRKMKDLEEQARKGLVSTSPAQILPSGLQMISTLDDPTRERARAQISDIEDLLDSIKACCSSAHVTASGLRDTLKQGGAE